MRAPTGVSVTDLPVASTVAGVNQWLVMSRMLFRCRGYRCSGEYMGHCLINGIDQKKFQHLPPLWYLLKNGLNDKLYTGKKDVRARDT